MSANKRSHSLLFALAILTLAALACSIGGSTSSTPAADLAGTLSALEATQAALEAAQNQATEAPAATEAVEDEVVTEDAPAFYTEEFDGDISLWTYFWTSGEEEDFDIYTQDGNLVFDIPQEDVVAYLTYDAYFYSDVRLDARVRNLGANKNWVSLVCRESDLGWYEFNIGNDGYYTIYLFDEIDDEYQELYSGGSQAIKTGKATNDYTVICNGDKLSLYINGVETRTVTNDFLDEGRVGISASSYDVVPVLLYYEWLQISEP